MDEQDVRELFEQQWRRALQLSRLLGATDPEDATAEAFARLYDHRDRVESPIAGVSYLRQIMLNLIRDQGRRAALARSRQGGPVSSLTDPDPTADADVIGAVKSLPQRQREVVVLRFWLDLSERDTADAMNVSVGSVKTHLSRAISALRPILERSRT